MNGHRKMLSALIGLKVGLISEDRFAEACRLWQTNPKQELIDVLIQRGWLLEKDRASLDYLAQRQIQREQLDTQIGDAGHPADSAGKSTRQSSADDADDIDSSSHITTMHRSPIKSTRYEIIRQIASGGFGRIWLAYDKQLMREVALKELHRSPAHDSTLERRFFQEARLTGQLQHPGVIPVHELVHAEGDHSSFYVMRLLQGKTLREISRDYHTRRQTEGVENWELQTMLNALVKVCETVAYAHSRGIIHRDIKGQNVVVGNYGEVVVLDWGLARYLATDSKNDSAKPPRHRESMETEQTVAGQVVGTPKYMSPEQAQGRLDLITERTDVYGLGALLYEILTGIGPAQGETIQEVVSNVIHGQPVAPSQINPQVPDLLEQICLRALSKNSGQRQGTAGELGREIELWQEQVRLQAVKALEDSEALYRSLVDALPIILVRKDREFRFTFLNKRACLHFGSPADQVLGKTDFDFFDPELSEQNQRSDQAVFDTANSFEFEAFPLFDLGINRYFQSIKSPVYDADGNIVEVQIVLWDVTTERIKSMAELAAVASELAEARQRIKELQS